METRTSQSHPINVDWVDLTDTGTIIGCWLRYRGIPAEQALAILRATRGPRCPETEGQCQTVRDFAVHETKEGDHAPNR